MPPTRPRLPQPLPQIPRPTLAHSLPLRALLWLRQAWFLLGALLREPDCLLARLAFIVGASYLFLPLDLIPDRIPIFGHLDEAASVLLGLIGARRLIPEAIVAEAMRQAAAAPPSPWLAGAIALLHRLDYRARRFGGHLTRRFTRQRDKASDPGPAGLFGLLGYRLWWRLRAPLAIRQPDTAPIIVIGGAARSGTTLLRHILARHPMIASGGETTVFLSRISDPATLAERMGGPGAGWHGAEIAAWQRAAHSQAEFIARFAAAVRERAAKPVWAEKTPRNIARFAFVRRHFPQARLVHIVRDGRDAVCSLREKPFAKLNGADPASLAAARRCALQWRDAVAAGLAWRDDPACHTLHYEDLIAAPEASLRRLMAFLDLPWDDALLAADHTEAADLDEARASGAIFDASIGRWRRDLSAAALTAIAPMIDPLLLAYGYDPAASRPSNAGTAATVSATAAAPSAMLRGP